MKWLFLLLLIINIGIFAWGYQHEQVKKQPAIEAGADVGDMRLISELEEDEKKEIVETTVDEDSEKTADEVGQTKQEQRPTDEEIPDIVEKTVTAAKEEVPASEVADKKDLSIETKKEKATQEQKTEEPGVVRRCGTIGPIKDRQVAKDLVEELKESELNAKLERKIEKQQIGYWVVIPPMEDGSQAQAKIDELAQAGVKDIWHFRGGGMKDAISLGMFAKKENAVNFTQEVLKKGFKTEMRPRYLNKTMYLVNFAIEKPGKAAQNMWHDIEQKYSKMPFSEQSCESIATK